MYTVFIFSGRQKWRTRWWSKTTAVTSEDRLLSFENALVCVVPRTCWSPVISLLCSTSCNHLHITTPPPWAIFERAACLFEQFTHRLVSIWSHHTRKHSELSPWVKSSVSWSFVTMRLMTSPPTSCQKIHSCIIYFPYINSVCSQHRSHLSDTWYRYVKYNVFSNYTLIGFC